MTGYHPKGRADLREAAVDLVIQWIPAHVHAPSRKIIEDYIDHIARSYLTHQALTDITPSTAEVHTRLREIEKALRRAITEIDRATWVEEGVINHNLSRLFQSDFRSARRSMVYLRCAVTTILRGEGDLWAGKEESRPPSPKVELAEDCWELLYTLMGRAPGYSPNSRLAQLSTIVYIYATGDRVGDSWFERSLDDLKRLHKRELRDGRDPRTRRLPAFMRTRKSSNAGRLTS